MLFVRIANLWPLWKFSKCAISSPFMTINAYSLLKETEMLRVALHDLEQLITHASPSL